MATAEHCPAWGVVNHLDDGSVLPRFERGGKKGEKLGEDLGKSLGGIYDRLTKIETILEQRSLADQQSSMGPRLQALELKDATMQGRMMGIGAAAGLAVSVILKLI